MDNKNALLAVVLSFIILFGYQYFFAPPMPEQPQPGTETAQQSADGEQAASAQQSAVPQPSPQALPVEASVKYDREPATTTVETDLYTAEFSEDGGRLTSFVLKDYRATLKKDSPGVQLVNSTAEQGYPLGFTWGSVTPERILYTAGTPELKLSGDGSGTLTMTAQAGNGVTLVRTYSFTGNSYIINLDLKVTNGSDGILQGAPQLSQVDSSLGGGETTSADRFLFGGPSTYINGELHEVKASEFADAPVTLNGNIDWAGYEGNYFLCALIPEAGDGQSYTMQGTEELARTRLSGEVVTLQPGAAQNWNYKLFYGPKKVSLLRELGYNLDKAVSYGWFTVLAKPMLWMLNLFYTVFRNYGVAIILLTVLIKAIFWPISQKGMKSMKNMQKLQPKMAKLKEKYKDDPQAMNREVMNLYKTYKVNPLGGCLPMVIQIPFFFALYRVLLASIELRHAPFMLWINDLAAPDRLFLGFDIPMLGGLPVLTLLMGASMWLQQKMTPTTADPTQAKIMMMLPVIFTFMFLNFPSGLVLYWLTNNLLSILQQVMINREKKGNVPAKA